MRCKTMKDIVLNRLVRHPQTALLVVLLVLLLTVGAVGEVAAQPDLGLICEFAEGQSGQDFPCENYIG